MAALGRPADLIGFHGQTILHQPDRRRTWQVGDAGELSRRTGIPVAHDFRSADVAGGGQGAPLAPVYHAALARDVAKPLAVLNIGGVANVTWIGANGGLVAFDTGPGNGPLDDWIACRSGAAFDRDGAIARSGRVDTAVLNRLLADPYFSRAAAEIARPAGLRRLARREPARAPVASRWRGDPGCLHGRRRRSRPAAGKPLRWVVTGGGRHNPAIMAALRDRLGVPVDPVEALGWDGDAIEAQCFGFLAAAPAPGCRSAFRHHRRSAADDRWQDDHTHRDVMPEVGSQPWLWPVTVLMAAVIVYGSLYPFGFRIPPSGTGPV